mgnify:CR=1 FL=1
MKVAEAIVKYLEKENVRVVFGYPGATVVPLYEALRQSDIKHVLVRHEQAAGHSASGYARADGSVGVCIATSGPGATNLITAIATAYMDSIPLVVITGQVKSNLIGKDVFQEADIRGATDSFTKHNYLLEKAEDIPRIIKEAFFIAKTGRPGPVLIDIPLNLQNEMIDANYPEEVSIRGYKPTVSGHKGQIKKALDALKTCERPLICVGGGVISSNAKAELEEFINKSRIPVVHTLMGKDGINQDNDYYIGLIGSHGFPYANKAISKADILILLGTRIADRATAGSNFARNAEIIHIDIDPAEIGKNLGPTIPVVGDLKNILMEMNKAVEAVESQNWLDELNKLKNEHKVTVSREGLASAKVILDILTDITDDNVILTADVGQNQIWSARNFKITGSRNFFTSGGLGTMGYSIPAAVGAKLAAPHRTVIAVMGDGGFQMSMFELGTIAENNIKLIILLFNNSGLGMVREIQKNTYGTGNYHGVNINHNPDFVKIAEAYGLKGRKVYSNEEFEKTYREAEGSNKTFLIECIIDPEEGTF